MSQKEFQRVKVIENAAGGRLSVREASRLLQREQQQPGGLGEQQQPGGHAFRSSSRHAFQSGFQNRTARRISLLDGDVVHPFSLRARTDPRVAAALLTLFIRSIIFRAELIDRPSERFTSVTVPAPKLPKPSRFTMALAVSVLVGATVQAIFSLPVTGDRLTVKSLVGAITPTLGNAR